MEQHFSVRSIDELDTVITALQEKMQSGDVVCFHGNLGAGKTTLIKRLCASLGVSEIEMSSPSFGIVNEYKSSSGESIYHFDLYRLNEPEELLDIGWEEYLGTGDFIFIEWPEIAEAFIPVDAFHIFIHQKENERQITLTYQS